MGSKEVSRLRQISAHRPYPLDPLEPERTNRRLVASGPDQCRAFVGEIVFASLRAKLANTAPGVGLLPQPATAWTRNAEGPALAERGDVTSLNGAPFRADADACPIDHSLTFTEIRRRSDLAFLAGAEAHGPHEIRIDHFQPDAAKPVSPTPHAKRPAA